MADYTNVVVSGTTRRVNTGDNYTSTTVTAAGLLEMVGGNAYATTLESDGRLWMQTQAYASGVAVGGGSCRISAFHAGTILEDVHIDSGANAAGTWRLDIRAGVKVSNAVVSGAAIQHTGAGAVIDGLVMDQGAMMYTYNYASAYNVTVESANAAQLRLYNHGYVSNFTVKKGNLQIFGQGFAENLHIYDKAQIWSSGTDGAGSANNVTVYKGGTLEMLTAAVGSNVTVSGVMTVASAAVVSGVSAYGDNTNGATASAYVKVSSGGKLVGGVISGARVDVSAGATAENIVVSRGYGLVVRGATVSNCSAVGTVGHNYLFLQQGAKLEGGYFADNGRLRIESGCSATDLVFENSIANAQFIIDPGANISGYTLRGNTLLDLRGTALNGTVSGGTLSFASGGTLTGLTVSNGGNFNFGTTGDITDVNVKAGGKLFDKFSFDHDLAIAAIADGVATVADNVTVTSARMDVKADGVASGTTISGGNAVVSTGGSFTNGNLLGTNTGGATNANYFVVSDGGKISDTVVSGFRVDVSAGASAENVTVTYGYGLVVRGATATNVSAVGTAGKNYLFIQSASIANGAYIANNGEFRLDGNCSATDVVFDNGGATIIGNGAYTSKLTIRGANANIGYAGNVFDATVSGGTLNFSSGTLTDLTVSAGAANVRSDGIVNDLTVKAGTANVSGGGIANNVTVEGGIAYAYVGGSINGATVKSGAEIAASKGTIENVTVEKGASLYIRDGGFVSGATISGYTDMYTGTLSSAYVKGGELRVYNPGYAENVWVDTAPLIVRYAGAVVSKAYVSGGKITSVQNRGILRELTQSDGRLRIDVNGTAAGTVSGATLTNVWTEIFDTGELSGFVAAGNSTVVNTGAKLLDGTALSGNRIDVMGGYASKITVSSGAQIWVSSGGMITDLTLNGAYAEVNAGGNISGATVNKAGATADFRVYNGLAEDIELTGGIVVVRGANASGANISATGAGNTVHAQAGGRITGVKIESGAQLLINNQGGTIGGSVFSAVLNNAKTNIHHQGYVSGFDAVGGSMLVDSGAKIFDGTMKGGDIILNSGAQMVDVAAADGATVTITGEYKAAATIVGSKTAFGEGALTYGEVALDGAAKNGVISGLDGHGSEFRLGIGDGITVKDAHLDNGNTRISAFNGANVDGAYVTAGAVICNAGASGAMTNVTLEGAGIMNLSGTATADNTVIKAGGKLSLNTANVKVDNTTIYAGGTFSNVNSADTGAAFTCAFENTAATMNVDLTKIATSTTLFATGVEALGTYALGSAGTFTGVTQKWGLYENAIAANGSYADALNGLTYAFDGSKITTTALEIKTGAAAGLSGDNYTALRTNDRAAKWTEATDNATLVTENFSGDAFLTVAGDAAAAIYGAGVDFAGTVNIDAKSGTIRNLAAGAEAGKSVGAVKLTFEGATLDGVGYAGGFGTVTGKTETLISDGTFTKDFYAGALANYKSTGVQTTVDDVSLTIDGGTFSGNIYGASAVKSSVAGAHSAGDVTLTITDGSTTKGAQACIFAGGYATGSAANTTVYTVDSVTLDISGGSWGTAAGGRGIFGGIMASGVTAEAGDVEITISGGTMGNVYGGGWAQKTNGKSIVGDVSITIAGTAQVANVFGGGSHSSSGGTTETGDITITVAGGNITGTIYAKGQLDGDTTGTATVIFTGANDYGCDVFGYSKVGGSDSSEALIFTDYTGTLSGTVGGFNGIKFSDGTAMTLTTASGDVSNTAWTFDFKDRDDTLAGTSLLTWSTADFAGDTVRVNFTDATQAASEWSIATADFTGATFNAYAGNEVIATNLAYNTAIADGDWAGWKFTDDNGTLKFKKLA